MIKYDVNFAVEVVGSMAGPRIIVRHIYVYAPTISDALVEAIRHKAMMERISMISEN